MPKHIKEAICYSCKNYLGIARCLAFKEGIPAEILLMEHDHHEAYEGDGGIMFEAQGTLIEPNETAPVRNPPPKDDEPAKGELVELAKSIKELAHNIQQPTVTVVQEAARPVSKRILRDADGRLIGIDEVPAGEEEP